MGRFLVLLTAILLAACSAVASSGDGSAANGRIRDYADLLSPTEEARLAERLADAEQLYGPQVGIVTVRSLEGRPIKDFTTDLANEWGLGDKERDDGLIILVAPNERQVRIGTGSGIEQSYSDAWAQRVVDTMTEHFRQQHWNRGLAAGLTLIIGRMKQHPTIPANDSALLKTSETA